MDILKSIAAKLRFEFAILVELFEGNSCVAPCLRLVSISNCIQGLGFRVQGFRLRGLKG